MSFSATLISLSSSFFFNATPTTEIYTLSLHDALPISILPSNLHKASPRRWRETSGQSEVSDHAQSNRKPMRRDRKSTRLNSSHGYISYAVFCLKKKTKTDTNSN